MNLADKIKQWDKEQNALDVTWNKIHTALKEAEIVSWSGIVHFGIEFMEATEEGMRVELWTSSYGGDSKRLTIPWKDLERVVEI